MLDHVLGAAAATPEIAETRVVGGDRWVRDAATRRGATWLGDTAALNPPSKGRRTAPTTTAPPLCSSCPPTWA